MGNKPDSSSPLEFRLHPLVLINVGDHHTRVQCNTPPPRDATATVMGCLLGVQSGRVVDIRNSFEVIRGVDGIDWDFTQRRLQQYKTVFPDVDLVGWYTVGETELNEQHMAIQRRMMEMNESPVLLVMQAPMDPLQKDLPVTLYETEVHLIDDASSFIFVKAGYTITTEEAENIGVNQVAKTSTTSGDKGSGQFMSHLGGLYSAVKMLRDRLASLFALMDKMESGEIELDHGLMRSIAGLALKVPLLDDPSFRTRFSTEYNDTLLTIHLSAVTKGVHTANTILEKSQYLLDRPRKKFVPIG